MRGEAVKHKPPWSIQAQLCTEAPANPAQHHPCHTGNFLRNYPVPMGQQRGTRVLHVLMESKPHSILLFCRTSCPKTGSHFSGSALWVPAQGRGDTVELDVLHTAWERENSGRVKLGQWLRIGLNDLKDDATIQ